MAGLDILAETAKKLSIFISIASSKYAGSVPFCNQRPVTSIWTKDCNDKKSYDLSMQRIQI